MPPQRQFASSLLHRQILFFSIPSSVFELPWNQLIYQSKRKVSGVAAENRNKSKASVAGSLELISEQGRLGGKIVHNNGTITLDEIGN
jgi:hypothetical protein